MHSRKLPRDILERVERVMEFHRSTKLTAASVRAQPTVLDRQVFVGSASGLVQALDLESGCVKWTFQATGPVRSAILAVPSGTAHALAPREQLTRYTWTIASRE